MKRIFYTYAILLVTNLLLAQNLDHFEKSDTLYIPFKGKCSEKKYDIQTRSEVNDFSEKAFQFNMKKSKFILNFQYVKYKNPSKKEANITSERINVGKDFIQKHKNKILSISLLKQLSYAEIACEIFSQTKTLYVVDYTTKNEIIIYEVNSMNYCPSIE